MGVPDPGALTRNACGDPIAEGGATTEEILGTGSRPAIVLVHGAFADGSSWNEVIAILQRDGYVVTAVQNQMASLADDIANTRRVIDAQTGPVVAVGHSYGGSVITGAAAGSANVRALVYVAAYGPDTGESVGSLNDQFAPPAISSALVPDAAGFLYIDRAKFHDVFCADLPAAQAAIMAATQRPPAAAVFGESIETPAWKTIPSWYLVSSDDQATNPEAQRFMAARMGARTTEVSASHVAFISHPAEVAELIEQAARSDVGATV